MSLIYYNDGFFADFRLVDRMYVSEIKCRLNPFTFQFKVVTQQMLKKKEKKA